MTELLTEEEQVRLSAANLMVRLAMDLFLEGGSTEAIAKLDRVGDRILEYKE